MKIAVNTRFLLNDYLEGYGYFEYEVLKRIVIANPEDEFLFIFDRPYDSRFLFAKNVTPVIAGPPARHPLLWKWWYDVRIPSILRKFKADVFVSCDGFCSLRTKVPQCLVIHDLSFLRYPSFIKRSHLFFYKRYTPKFIKKAKTLATVSAFSKNDIIAHYKTDPGKINIVYSAAKDIFYPLNETDKEATKAKYTDGKNYFVYAGAIHPRKNLLHLLKAFSVFKKRQQSDWKLVLAGRLAWQYDHFIESLKAYKYRDDVVLTGYVEEKELAKIIGSAYVLVYASLWEGFGVPVLEGMRSGVAVITSINSSMQEIAGDAALFANPADHTDIADKMMLLYKNES
jgi:glycosyltransferase involved in cell wall biosynthesis